MLLALRELNEKKSPPFLLLSYAWGNASLDRKKEKKWCAAVWRRLAGWKKRSIARRKKGDGLPAKTRKDALPLGRNNANGRAAVKKTEAAEKRAE